MISPVAVTISKPKTECFVTPYFGVRIPPAFSAILPPMNDLYNSPDRAGKKTVFFDRLLNSKVVSRAGKGVKIAALIS